MYLFQKAGKNLLKNKGRNLVIFVILSIVTLASLVSLTVFYVTGQIGKATENYYAGEITITPEDGNLTAEDYKLFADSDYLRSYVFYESLPIVIKDLQLLDGEYYDATETQEGASARNIVPNARVYGLLDENSTDDFSYGERNITEGVFPKNEDECIISDALADLNGLSLGDTVTFVVGREQLEKTMTISGIFTDTTIERRQANHRSPALNTRNDIIVTYTFFDKFEESMDSAASFLLNDANDLEAFQNELYEKGLPESYTLLYDTARYDQAAAEIKQMSSLVGLFMGIIAAIGVSVVFLINLFAIRERKYEIGVLRAIGMSKPKVMFLLIGEMLILALIAAVIAIMAGIFINPPVIDFMMKLEMNHELPSALKAAAGSINSSFSPFVTLELIALTAALVLLAGGSTISAIMRFDPMKILSERN